MKFDHVHFYVNDAGQWRDWFVRKMGLQAIARGKNAHTYTEVVSNGILNFLLSSPLDEESPVAKYLRCHPPGVADIAFSVKDVALVLERALARGAKLLQAIKQKHFTRGSCYWCQIAAQSGFLHTLMERRGVTPVQPEAWVKSRAEVQEKELHFVDIDHIVLNVPQGELDATVAWYKEALGFEGQQDFRIQTGNSGLYSRVMVHPEEGIKLPINEPTSTNSQIQEFLDINRGVGVQHIALKTKQIIEATSQLRQAGVDFLAVPATYYEQISQRQPPINLAPPELEAIATQEILVDAQRIIQSSSQPSPLLLQIFTQPIFAEPTFFFELIERRQEAKGFGKGNFQALFEAMEQEQLRRGGFSGFS